MPFELGSDVNLTGFFTDPGAEDTHTATWKWGDGQTTAVSTSGYTVGGSHTYNSPGVYTVTLTVTDDDGGFGNLSYQYVVVYDPIGGFATGGGWYNTPGGKANFGINAKYHPDVKIPYGNTEFKVGDLKFKSTAYDWLVVSAERAKYKGIGTINNAGEFGFLVTVIDGKISGVEDLIRIKIWDLATGDIVYDSQPGYPNTAHPTTKIGGGSIVIHKDRAK